ncbi:MAG TPA: asparagine synthase (glutamine-hydrolyzing) [Anaerolineales bacterium]|nr:asparagine synthase (glutamine-hydrolyzing) [Anaerolineales bacterium]
MCGICGVLHFDNAPVDEASLSRMVETILHRGPDDSGTWVDGGVGLGNTRLAIIDLSPAGHQPLSNETGEVWIAFNGEIYNFQSLRPEVESRGHTFRSRTDTETIVHLFEDRGIECLQSLRGMFALALWDGRKRELWLARDRLGKKPLYYFADSQRLIFGSEIKCILAYPDVPRSLNRSVLPLYLAYGYIPAPETIYAGIRMLRPGCWLRVSDGQIEEREYWTVPTPTPASSELRRGEVEWAEVLLDHLREAVRLRLISDVPLGAFLSGGLDSSAVVALMAEAASGPVKTFAMGFAGEPSYDETAHARIVARHLGTDHHEFIVEPQTVDLVTKLAWHLDQPFGDSSIIPTYLVSKLAREHVTVALTGDGGDELFAGYDRFQAARLAQRYRAVPAFAHRGLVAVARRLPQGTGYHDLGRRVLRFVSRARLRLPEQHLGWVGVMAPELVDELIGHVGAGLAEGPHSGAPVPTTVVSHYESYFRVNNGGDPVPALLDVNLRTYLPDDLLIKADRMSMAASLEARSPFLDHVLIEFAVAMPVDFKLRNGVSKYILKKAFAGKLPNEIIYRQKHGFGMPVGKWFRTTLCEYLTDTLLSPRAAQRGLLNPIVLQRMVNGHLSGGRDYGFALWTLMMLEVWAQQNLD